MLLFFSYSQNCLLLISEPCHTPFLFFFLVFMLLLLIRFSSSFFFFFFCIFAYLFIYSLNESISYTKLVNSFFFLVYWHSSISHNRIVPLLKNESKMCVWASLLFWILDGHCHLLLGIFIGTSHRTLCCAVLSCSVVSDS